MAFIADAVFDLALATLTTNLDRVDITNAEATNYTEATSTFTLGFGTTTTGSAEAGDVDGRKVIVAALVGDDVDSTDTASHWAGTDGTSILYVTNTLASSQAVTSGNTFDLAAADITIRDAA